MINALILNTFKLQNLTVKTSDVIEMLLCAYPRFVCMYPTDGFSLKKCAPIFLILFKLSEILVSKECLYFSHHHIEF